MFSYSPGRWSAAVTPSGAALLAPDVSTGTVCEIWRAMSGGGGLGAVLESLVGTFGTSLSALPSFAIVIHDAEADEVRVMVRGAVRARVRSADGNDAEFSGVGVATWSERLIASPHRIAIMGPDPLDGDLPLRDGVVAAGGLWWVAPGAAQEEETDAAAPASADAAASAEPVAGSAGDEPWLAVAAETIADYPDHTFGTVPGPALADPPGDGLAPLELTQGYDDLFGETQIRTVEDAAVRQAPDDEVLPEPTPSPPSPAPSPAPPLAMVPPVTDPPVLAPPTPASPPGLISGIPSALPPARAIPALRGDHDGETVSAAQLAAIVGGLPGEAPVTASASPRGEAGSPVLVVSTGERVALDRGAIVGRRPRSVRSTGVVPHLVTVDSPTQDISRSHVELRFEGGYVLAVDLDTTNGTRLLRAGAEPLRLHPGEATLLVAADRLDLGDGVVLAFEGLQ